MEDLNKNEEIEIRYKEIEFFENEFDESDCWNLKYLMNEAVTQIMKLEEIEAFKLFDFKIEYLEIDFILNCLEKIFNYYEKNSKIIFSIYTDNFENNLIKLTSYNMKKESSEDFYILMSLHKMIVSRFRYKYSHLCAKNLVLFRSFQEIYDTLLMVVIGCSYGEKEFLNQFLIYNFTLLAKMKKESEKYSDYEARYSRYLILSHVVLNFFETEELMNNFFEKYFIPLKVEEYRDIFQYLEKSKMKSGANSFKMKDLECMSWDHSVFKKSLSFLEELLICLSKPGRKKLKFDFKKMSNLLKEFKEFKTIYYYFRNDLDVKFYWFVLSLFENCIQFFSENTHKILFDEFRFLEKLGRMTDYLLEKKSKFLKIYGDKIPLVQFKDCYTKAEILDLIKEKKNIKILMKESEQYLIEFHFLKKILLGDVKNDKKEISQIEFGNFFKEIKDEIYSRIPSDCVMCILFKEELKIVENLFEGENNFLRKRKFGKSSEKYFFDVFVPKVLKNLENNLRVGEEFLINSIDSILNFEKVEKIIKNSKFSKNNSELLISIKSYMYSVLLKFLQNYTNWIYHSNECLNKENRIDLKRRQEKFQNNLEYLPSDMNVFLTSFKSVILSNNICLLILRNLQSGKITERILKGLKIKIKRKIFFTMKTSELTLDELKIKMLDYFVFIDEISILYILNKQKNEKFSFWIYNSINEKKMKEYKSFFEKNQKSKEVLIEFCRLPTAFFPPHTFFIPHHLIQTNENLKIINLGFAFFYFLPSLEEVSCYRSMRHMGIFFLRFIATLSNLINKKTGGPSQNKLTGFKKYSNYCFEFLKSFLAQKSIEIDDLQSYVKSDSNDTAEDKIENILNKFNIDKEQENEPRRYERVLTESDEEREKLRNCQLENFEKNLCFVKKLKNEKKNNSIFESIVNKIQSRLEKLSNSQQKTKFEKWIFSSNLSQNNEYKQIIYTKIFNFQKYLKILSIIDQETNCLQEICQNDNLTEKEEYKTSYFTIINTRLCIDNSLEKKENKKYIEDLKIEFLEIRMFLVKIRSSIEVLEFQDNPKNFKKYKIFHEKIKSDIKKEDESLEKICENIYDEINFKEKLDDIEFLIEQISLIKEIWKRMKNICNNLEIESIFRTIILLTSSKINNFKSMIKSFSQNTFDSSEEIGIEEILDYFNFLKTNLKKEMAKIDAFSSFGKEKIFDIGLEAKYIKFIFNNLCTELESVSCFYFDITEANLLDFVFHSKEFLNFILKINTTNGKVNYILVEESQEDERGYLKKILELDESRYEIVADLDENFQERLKKLDLSLIDFDGKVSLGAVSYYWFDNLLLDHWLDYYFFNFEKDKNFLEKRKKIIKIFENEKFDEFENKSENEETVEGFENESLFRPTSQSSERETTHSNIFEAVNLSQGTTSSKNEESNQSSATHKTKKHVFDFNQAGIQTESNIDSESGIQIGEDWEIKQATEMESVSNKISAMTQNWTIFTNSEENNQILQDIPEEEEDHLVFNHAISSKKIEVKNERKIKFRIKLEFPSKSKKIFLNTDIDVKTKKFNSLEEFIKNKKKNMTKFNFISNQPIMLENSELGTNLIAVKNLEICLNKKKKSKYFIHKNQRQKIKISNEVKSYLGPSQEVYISPSNRKNKHNLYFKMDFPLINKHMVSGDLGSIKKTNFEFFQKSFNPFKITSDIKKFELVLKDGQERSNLILKIGEKKNLVLNGGGDFNDRVGFSILNSSSFCVWNTVLCHTLYSRDYNYGFLSLYYYSTTVDEVKRKVIFLNDFIREKDIKVILMTEVLEGLFVCLTGVKEKGKYFLKFFGLELRNPSLNSLSVEHLNSSKIVFEIVYEVNETCEVIREIISRRERFEKEGNSEGIKKIMKYWLFNLEIFKILRSNLGMTVRWIKNEKGRNETLFLLVPRGKEKYFGFEEEFHLYFIQKGIVNWRVESFFQGLNGVDLIFDGCKNEEELIQEMKESKRFWTFENIEELFILGNKVGFEDKSGDIFGCEVRY